MIRTTAEFQLLLVREESPSEDNTYLSRMMKRRILTEESLEMRLRLRQQRVEEVTEQSVNHLQNTQQDPEYQKGMRMIIILMMKMTTRTQQLLKSLLELQNLSLGNLQII